MLVWFIYTLLGFDQLMSTNRLFQSPEWSTVCEPVRWYRTWVNNFGLHLSMLNEHFLFNKGQIGQLSHKQGWILKSVLWKKRFFNLCGFNISGWMVHVSHHTCTWNVYEICKNSFCLCNFHISCIVALVSNTIDNHVSIFDCSFFNNHQFTTVGLSHFALQRNTPT